MKGNQTKPNETKPNEMKQNQMKRNLVEASSFSPSEGTPHILWNLKVHYYVCKRPPLVLDHCSHCSAGWEGIPSHPV